MLLLKVEKFLRKHEMPATKFGRLAAHDPRFVLDLRLGRIPRERTEARTLKWMAEFEAAERRAQTSAGQSPAHLPANLETKELVHAV